MTFIFSNDSREDVGGWELYFTTGCMETYPINYAVAESIHSGKAST